MILILEDDQKRLHRFMPALDTICPDRDTRVWCDARVMIRDLEGLLPRASLVSLDHDLLPETPGGDPGDGLDVASFLAAQPACAPVIVHSSNGTRSSLMMSLLREQGWMCVRVAPFGEDWIERDWAGVVSRLMQR